jgi:hypothetical protein
MKQFVVTFDRRTVIGAEIGQGVGDGRELREGVKMGGVCKGKQKGTECRGFSQFANE